MKHLWANAVDLLCWVIVLPTLAYLGYRSFQQSADRRALGWKLAVSVPLILLILILLWIHTPRTFLYFLIPTVILGLMWTPTLSDWLSTGLTNLFDGGTDEVEAKPFYFIAEGKRRQGLFAEAMAEVQKQLERFPGDYEGYMKLALIQVESLHDLAAAQVTVDEFLELPGSTTNHKVAALYELADWQLRFGRDASAAAATMQRIIQLYPGTSLAHTAQQRIARLGLADETRKVRYESKFKVGPGEQDMGLRAENHAASDRVDPQTRAAEYVKQLELHPADTETREKLAILHVEELHQLELGIGQLEQLIALPVEHPKNIARWLNLLATWQIKQAKDLAEAERALRRIIERFPEGALAGMAVTRLASLPSELKAGQETSLKTLAIHEKHLGLKQSDDDKLH